jgi:hypothetical protein
MSEKETSSHIPIEPQTQQAIDTFLRWLRFAKFRRPFDGQDVNLLKCVDGDLDTKLQPLL